MSVICRRNKSDRSCAATPVRSRMTPRRCVSRGVARRWGVAHWTQALDTKNFLIVLDGDDAVLKTVARIAGPYYHVRATRDSRTLLGWMQELALVEVIVTEHVLRTSNGISLLETARSCRPNARRVLMTTYHD